jgi:ElaB/YqjD/DUF883 family membrane-anchored ribosome-binding protein
MGVGALDNRFKVNSDPLALSSEETPEEPSIAPLPPAYQVPGGRAVDQTELMNVMRDMLRISRAVTADPSSISVYAKEILDVIEKLMIMLAREERNAKHDRFAAKMAKLIERIEKMLSAAQKTLEAGKKELDAISKKSGFQLAFAILAVVIIAVAIVAAVFTGGTSLMLAAALLGAGAALGGIMLPIGSSAGELAARGDTEKKHELNEEAADFQAIAAELEKLMENEGELSNEAKEMLRKLLEILSKIFEKLNASRTKQSEGLAQ